VRSGLEVVTRKSMTHEDPSRDPLSGAVVRVCRPITNTLDLCIEAQYTGRIEQGQQLGERLSGQHTAGNVQSHTALPRESCVNTTRKRACSRIDKEWEIVMGRPYN
jgi:hypothetical protein